MSIFDDDTGEPINLTGITLLKNPNGFLGSNWQVFDGAIVTSSTSTLFVPGYPVTNQLLALSLNVDLSLGILAGDLITITDVNGNATMTGYVTGYTPSTGGLTVQIGLNFQLEIRNIMRGHHGDDYAPWFDWGGGAFPTGGHPIIIAVLGKGLSIIDVGYVQI